MFFFLTFIFEKFNQFQGAKDQKQFYSLVCFGSPMLWSIVLLQLSFSILFKYKLNSSSYFHVNVYWNNTTTIFPTFSLCPLLIHFLLLPCYSQKLNYVFTSCIQQNGIIFHYSFIPQTSIYSSLSMINWLLNCCSIHPFSSIPLLGDFVAPFIKM